MLKHLLNGAFVLTASVAARNPAAKPISVEIVTVPSEQRDYGTKIGNVKVRYSDGHSEVWTSQGKYQDAHVSQTGIVGWTRHKQRNSYGDPMNGTLRLRLLDGSVKDFTSSPFNGPFIEEWAFADHDSSVVIKTRGRHGPPMYAKFSIGSGKLVSEVGRSTTYETMPAWARPIADDRPKP